MPASRQITRVATYAPDKNSKAITRNLSFLLKLLAALSVEVPGTFQLLQNPIDSIRVHPHTITSYFSQAYVISAEHRHTFHCCTAKNGGFGPASVCQ